MKIPWIVLGISILPALIFPSAAGSAKTATGTIAESANIVPGNSISAFVIGTNIFTIAGDSDAARFAAAHNVRAAARVAFETHRYEILVRRINWNKGQKILTIDL